MQRLFEQAQDPQRPPTAVDCQRFGMFPWVEQVTAAPAVRCPYQSLCRRQSQPWTRHMNDSGSQSCGPDNFSSCAVSLRMRDLTPPRAPFLRALSPMCTCLPRRIGVERAKIGPACGKWWTANVVMLLPHVRVLAAPRVASRDFIFLQRYLSPTVPCVWSVVRFSASLSSSTACSRA